MALALNNLTKVDMPLNKETKPNHPTNNLYNSLHDDFAIWVIYIFDPVEKLV